MGVWHFEGSPVKPARVSDPRSDLTLWEMFGLIFSGFENFKKMKIQKSKSKVSDPRSDLTLWRVFGHTLESVRSEVGSDTLRMFGLIFFRICDFKKMKIQKMRFQSVRSEVGSDTLRGLRPTAPKCRIRFFSRRNVAQSMILQFFLRSGHWINDTCFWDSFLFEAEPCIMSLNVTLTFWMLSNLEGICPCHHHTEELCTNLRVSMLHHARLLHAFTVVHLVGENLAAIVCESWPRPMCLEEATAGRSQTLWLLVGVTVSWWLWNLEVEICI